MIKRFLAWNDFVFVLGGLAYELKSIVGKVQGEKNDSDISYVKTREGRVFCYVCLRYVLLKPVLANDFC